MTVHGLFFAMLAAFAANILILSYTVLDSASALPRRRAAALAAVCVLFLGTFSLVSSRVVVRGGYDNDHDVSLLSSRLWPYKPQLLMKLDKERSPLLMDHAADFFSGGRLDAHPVKNRALLGLSALLFAWTLAGAGLGLAGWAAGLVIFGFNAVTLLNSSVVTTTGANVFYFMCSLLAAVRYARAPGLLNGAWAAAALLLVAGGRKELLPVPAALLLASWFFRFRLDRRAALDWKVYALPAFGLALCAVWLAAVAGSEAYTGPDLAILAGPFLHLKAQLGDLNLSRMFPVGGWTVAALVFMAAAFNAWAAVRAGAAALPRTLAAICLCGFYFSAIFVSRDLYPLHFIRHQLYFFPPFAALAALTAHNLSLFASRRRAAGAALLAAGLALYAAAGVRAALSLNGSLRTNDVEWSLLMEAQRAWPEGCGLLYPPEDEHKFMLWKYFPMAQDRAAADGCVIKYLSHKPLVFSDGFGARKAGYGELPQDYLFPKDKVFVSTSVEHAFYTNTEAENRSAGRIRFGFFYAASGSDAGWLGSRRALHMLKTCRFQRGLELAAGAAAGGKGGELGYWALALAEGLSGNAPAVKKNLALLKESGALAGREKLAEAVTLAASGRCGEAASAAENFAYSVDNEALSSAASALAGALNCPEAVSRCAR